ncbi:MAG: hypothetical protein AB1779_06555 [Candidatus Thermoplasmatota archaeon]
MVKVIATVKRGKCLGGDLMPGEICIGALIPMLPIVLGLQNGAEFPWEPDKNVFYAGCLDEKNMLRLEIRRKIEQEKDLSPKMIGENI